MDMNEAEPFPRRKENAQVCPVVCRKACFPVAGNDSEPTPAPHQRMTIMKENKQVSGNCTMPLDSVPSVCGLG